MKSLFLKMFLGFCAANAVLVCLIVGGYELANPDQLPFTWPRVGKGAIVSAARVAIDEYERGGQEQLAHYLGTLHEDTGLDAALFDSSNRALGSGPGPSPPDDLAASPEGQLMTHVRRRLAGVRLHGRLGSLYSFVAIVPRREAGGFWSRTFLVLLTVTGAVLCYLLAQYISAPVVQLRAAAFRFSRGDLGARVTVPRVLQRKDEIGGLAGDFNRMAERIESLMKAQQRLIADVSHELRSPLTRPSLALELVRRHKEAGVGPRLARMEREVERLNTLIGQLLTLSRLESVDRPPPMEMLDLSALIQQISADADFEAAGMNRGVQLVECDECAMMGAADLIRSALENVVRNAVKFTAPATEVLIRLVRAGETRAEITVQDNGPGAPDQALAHIFEPFYRADDARDRGTGGAGLGLAITRQVVRLHGGSVRAMNRESGGLEVRVTLPLVRP